MHAAADIPRTTPAVLTRAARRRWLLIGLFAAGSLTLTYGFFNDPFSHWNGRAERTRADMRSIGVALEQYFEEHRTYPASLPLLVPEYLPADIRLTDGWRRQLYYEPTSVAYPKTCILRSSGPDGLSGTQDDIDLSTLAR